MSELPQLERALNDAAHRRYGRARWRLRTPRAAREIAVAAALTAVVIAVSAGVISVISDSAGPDERPATQPAQAWTTTVNKQHGFTVSLPPGWALSAERLTPNLSDPREVLSAGTFPLAYRQGGCNHMPDGALRSMGSADGFVSVQERGRRSQGGRAGFPPRPASFGAYAKPSNGDLAVCLGHSPTVEYWIPFSDGNRLFYALVVLGRRVSDQTRNEAFAILDRLRFDPTAQPGWRSTP